MAAIPERHMSGFAGWEDWPLRHKSLQKDECQINREGNTLFRTSLEPLGRPVDLLQCVWCSAVGSDLVGKKPADVEIPKADAYPRIKEDAQYVQGR